MVSVSAGMVCYQIGHTGCALFRKSLVGRL